MIDISDDFYCPKCKQELEEGYLSARGEILWSNTPASHSRGKPLVRRSGSMFGEYSIRAKRCRRCRIIIYPEYSK